MGMQRQVAGALLAGVMVCVPGSARAERSAITVASEGHQLRVVVHGVLDYCTSDADTQVVLRAGTIRIIRARPSRVSRCLERRDVTLVVEDVPAGTYRVTYEQVPLVAPARALTLASTTAVVDAP
jgi:hypothetical protein